MSLFRARQILYHLKMSTEAYWAHTLTEDTIARSIKDARSHRASEGIWGTALQLSTRGQHSNLALQNALSLTFVCLLGHHISVQERLRGFASACCGWEGNQSPGDKVSAWTKGTLPASAPPSSGQQHSVPLFQDRTRSARVCTGYEYPILAYCSTSTSITTAWGCIKAQTSVCVFQSLKTTQFYCVLQEPWTRLQKDKPGTFHATTFPQTLKSLNLSFFHL